MKRILIVLVSAGAIVAGCWCGPDGQGAQS